MRPIVAWVTMGLAVVATVGTAVVLVNLADGYSGFNLSIVVILGCFFLWGISPYVALGMGALWLAPYRFSSWVLLVTTVAATAFAGWAIVSALILHPDAQSGLVFLILPVWQWPFVLVAYAIAWLKAGMLPSASRQQLWRNFRGWWPKGYCGQCGYDLRGTAEGGACPECGEGGEKQSVNGQ